MSARLPDLQGRWAVAPLPKHRSGTSFLGGSNLAVFRSSENKAAALAFAQYLCSPDVQLRWYRRTGDLPAARESWSAPDFAADPRWSVFRAQLDNAQPPPQVETWETMAEVIKNRSEDLILGNQSPELVAAGIQQSLSQILGNRKPDVGNIARIAAAMVPVLSIAVIATIAFLAVSTRRQLRRCRDWITPVLFLSIPVTFIGLFVIVPIIASLFLSFTDTDIYSLGAWRRTSIIGFSNYLRLWRDPLFWRSVINTLYFIAAAGPLTLALALGSALMLNRTIPFKGLLRTGYFLPVVTPLVAVAVVWKWIYSPRGGMLNALLGTVGIQGQAWLADPYLAMPALIALAVWKNFGYSMVIFLAGLQAIPRSLYEAGAIDGAGAWKQFRHITLPLLRPTTVFVTIMTTVGFMQFFAEPYVMTEMGGPQNRTLSVVLYLYKEGFKFFHLGYASAVAYTLCFIIALLSVVQMRWARQVEVAA